jgi:hypothetical protein
MEFEPRRYLAMFVATILFVLASIFSVLLLIVPVVWIVGWYSLYQFPIVEHATNPIEALQESKRLAHDHKAKVWGIIGAVFVLTLPEFVLLFIPIIQYLALGYGMLISVVSTAVFASLYRHLQTVAEDER